MTRYLLRFFQYSQLIQPGEWCLIHGVGDGTCQWAAQVPLPSRPTRLASLSLRKWAAQQHRCSPAPIGPLA